MPRCSSRSSCSRSSASRAMAVERLPACSRWVFWLLLVVVLVAALAPARITMAATGWDKVSHVLLFAGLAMCGRWSYPRRNAMLLLGLLAYGVLIELLQGLTSYRSAELLDVVADGVGLLMGWQLMRLWRR